MSDLISKQEVIEVLNERARNMFTLDTGYSFYLGALHDVADDLRQMPTIDAVIVVRCKDCKYYEETDSRIGTCSLTISGAEIDGFCSWGERKDDADNRLNTVGFVFGEREDI